MDLLGAGTVLPGGGAVLPLAGAPGPHLGIVRGGVQTGAPVRRKSPEKSGKVRKSPEDSGRFRNLPESSGIFRTLPDFSGLFRNLPAHWRPCLDPTSADAKVGPRSSSQREDSPPTWEHCPSPEEVHRPPLFHWSSSHGAGAFDWGVGPTPQSNAPRTGRAWDRRGTGVGRAGRGRGTGVVFAWDRRMTGAWDGGVGRRAMGPPRMSHDLMTWWEDITCVGHV